MQLFDSLKTEKERKKKENTKMMTDGQTDRVKIVDPPHFVKVRNENVGADTYHEQAVLGSEDKQHSPFGQHKSHTFAERLVIRDKLVPEVVHIDYFSASLIYESGNTTRRRIDCEGYAEITLPVTDHNIYISQLWTECWLSFEENTYICIYRKWCKLGADEIT